MNSLSSIILMAAALAVIGLYALALVEALT